MNKINNFYNSIRIHDKLYLNENRYKKTKESFKFLIKILKKKIPIDKKLNILDVGCANGELIYNLNKVFSNSQITGMDVRADLLKKAKLNIDKKIKLWKADIQKKIKPKDNLKFDIIFCAGVLSIFDDQKKILSNIYNLLKKNGQLFFFGNFNAFNYNVFIKYQDIKNKEKLQSGWNIWSLYSIKKFFKNKKKKIELYPFFSTKNIKQKKEDPVRSWTIKIKNKRYFTNGLSILQNQYWVRVF